jgi:hypothetical protein
MSTAPSDERKEVNKYKESLHRWRDIAQLKHE